MMNKKVQLLMIFGLIFLAISCNRAHKKKVMPHPKDQHALNMANDSRLEGDHVLNAEELPVLTPDQKEQYIDKSKRIAKSAFDIFSAHLTRLFNEKKPGEALEYCHDHALRITDSLSKVYGVKIKRTSYRLRNPKNKPNVQEEKVMEIYRKRILSNLKPMPYMHYDEEGYPHVYLPIMVQEKCLMCHGDPNKDIPQAIMSKLSELYPSDKAIFFKKGDLRGIWSIRFPRITQKTNQK